MNEWLTTETWYEIETKNSLHDWAPIRMKRGDRKSPKLRIPLILEAHDFIESNPEEFRHATEVRIVRNIKTRRVAG